jgi:serine/threonine protein kinase
MTTNSGGAIEIFTEAIQLPTEDRAAFLDRACGQDEPLRRKIDALLRSNDRAEGFLEQPAATIGDGRARAVPGEKPGDVIDRYRLLQKIGEGGCGVVFVAEQQEPVHRRVAFKVVKPGMDTGSVIARFERERQALALMDHPNIAHVFDAGATASGRPYFVMELVEGCKITEYCDQHSLPIQSRLKLFVQVCDAIQHAHQKGIIHRDIKPSNILVSTGSDGRPMPKVIDFGIAKAIAGQELTDKTVYTAVEMLIGTPAYMSPEQAALGTTEVDTRTDIYSLGVLLYELLTGTTPFDTRELLKAGLDEVRRVVREEDPVRPSTRLSTMIAADPAEIPKRHGAEAPRLIREMRGDLDWIVMKAMEKDRARRYATANGLAMDVKRYLSGEAVVARPPSATYKFRKLVGRNKLVFSGVALIFVLLVISLMATTRWLMIELRTREQMRKRVEMAELEDLGWQLGSQGKSVEAEQTLRRALALSHQLPKGELTPVLLFNLLLQMFDHQKRLDKLSPFLIESVDPALLTRAEYKGLFEDAINTLVRHGRWNDADALAEALRKSAPADSFAYHIRAPLLAAKKEVEGYRLLCVEIVSRFSRTTDFYEADRMAKDCLILPSAGVDLKDVAAMSDLAVTKGKGNGSYHFFQCCKAMAEYRLGNYNEAVNWAQASAQNPFPHSQAEAYAVLAMSRYKLGNAEGAQSELANCNRVIETKLPAPGQDLGLDWRDWIIAHALQSEAKRLIEGESAPAAPPANLSR